MSDPKAEVSIGREEFAAIGRLLELHGEADRISIEVGYVPKAAALLVRFVEDRDGFSFSPSPDPMYLILRTAADPANVQVVELNRRTEQPGSDEAFVNRLEAAQP